MSQGIHRKIRPDAVWAEVRKAWEDGETARSVAARYDVGVPALWKRREAEGWKRPEPTQAPIEPAEGWDRHIQARRDAFNAQLEDARALAECLAAAMTDERLSRAPHWHIPWLYHWRATHLGPEATARDRARAMDLSPFRVTNHFAGFALTGRYGTRDLQALFAGLPEGVTELMTHPGHCTPELMNAPTRLKQSRAAELAALCDPLTRAALDENHIQLTRYQDL